MTLKVGEEAENSIESDLTQPTMTLAPNPNYGLLTIDVNAVKNIDDYAALEIFDLFGNRLQSFKFFIHGAGTEETVDLHLLPVGTYLVALRSKEFLVTKKLVLISRD